MDNLLNLSLLIFNDELHFWDGEHYISKFNWGEFAIALSPNFKKVFYAVPVKKIDYSDTGIIIEKEKVTFIPLPFWHSMLNFLFRLPAIFLNLRSIIKHTIKNSDVVYLRFPSLAGFLFFLYAKKLKKPIIIYIGGNIITQANPTIEGIYLVRLTSKLIAYVIHFFTRLVVNHSLLTFVKGNELIRLYKGDFSHVVPFITSQIKDELIFNNREDTCQSQPIRILRVSQLIPSCKVGDSGKIRKLWL